MNIKFVEKGGSVFAKSTEWDEMRITYSQTKAKLQKEENEVQMS